jgi:protein-S-isoprenylcysteine O-methyltransferase Ste14
MTAASALQPQLPQTHADGTTRAGGWLFKRRTIIPLPLALAVLLVPGASSHQASVVVAGIVLVAIGEAIRLWGVRHIGAISRTRSERLGPLVAAGPFALIRNPLYVGNIALWVGFALSAGVRWLAPLVAAILAFEYHAIVRWEERLLEERLGDHYRVYASQVPRWIPRTLRAGGRGASVFSWRETIYSERGTLIAIAIGFALLWLKAAALGLE